MSKARNLASIFTTASDMATDAEVTSAIAAHVTANDPHGDRSYSDTAISNHNTSANGHVKRGNTASRPASPTNGDVYMNTQLGYPEFYNGTTWLPIGAAPTAPTSVVATNVGAFPEYISDGYNGLLSAPDAEQFANAMMYALTDNLYEHFNQNLENSSFDQDYIFNNRKLKEIYEISNP